MLSSNRPGTLDDARRLGLFDEEFRRICDLMGRDPSFTELAMFSGMWSEHCSYKSSYLHIRRFFRDSTRLVAGPGEENAGALRISDRHAVVFKVESHNHPTAVEPYQGAATGVGGIMRDIFTMGARPLVSLNSLRFGDLKDHARSRWLFRRAIQGVGDYGNSLGIPVAGGEVDFHPCYNENPLVNAMTVGIANLDQMASARAYGPGNLVVYVGARTGRDGIHGASFASKALSSQSAEERSAVQVGDPFMEKLLMEATLECIATGAVVAIQDMGAAGLLSSSSEMSSRGNVGMRIHTDRVPARETGMEPFEFLLSESQERMLLVVQPDNLPVIEKVFRKWELEAAVIGEIIERPYLEVYQESRLYAEIPVAALTDEAPKYELPSSPPQTGPKKRSGIRNFVDAIRDNNTAAISAILTEHSASLQLCSREPVYDQFDSDVGIAKVIGPGHAAGVYRVPDSSQGVAVTLQGNPLVLANDARSGAFTILSAGWRALVAAGAEPIGITNCLNFGNPRDPDVYRDFAEFVAGLSDGARELNIPVISGNVSFYNQSESAAIWPSPTVGVVGIMDQAEDAIPGNFLPGQDVYVLGEFSPELDSSVYAWLQGARGERVSEPDPAKERESAKAFASVRDQIHGAMPLSRGGLMHTILRMTFAAVPIVRRLPGIRFRQDFLTDALTAGNDSWFFGETLYSYLIAVPAGTILPGMAVPCRKIATTDDSGSIGIPGMEISLDDTYTAWRDRLRTYLGN